MSTIANTFSWPSDPGHRDAIGTLLDMASAAARWGEHDRALTLLDRVEQIVGALPPGHERLRSKVSQHAVVTATRRGGRRLRGR